MNKNPRDIHGDGHGFVDVPIGRKPRGAGYWNYDLTRMPLQSKHPFVGLYKGPHNEHEPRLVIAADTTHHGFRLMSYENNHYMTDPLAWAEIPTW